MNHKQLFQTNQKNESNEGEVVNVSTHQVDGTRVVVQESKDGKTTMVFSGDQKKITSSMLDNIRRKLESRRKSTLLTSR